MIVFLVFVEEYDLQAFQFAFECVPLLESSQFIDILTLLDEQIHKNTAVVGIVLIG